jgi:hypothetical protein
MQKKPVTLAGKNFTALNDDEGWLIIWCPDEQADFMNAEKTEHLRSLETEQPPLTVLHTYINRKQRDPGALKDALDSGGYFFPTNPQSSDELQPHRRPRRRGRRFVWPHGRLSRDAG